MAEAFRAQIYPARFRSDEARMKVLGRTAGILGELEIAVRRELGADRIDPADDRAPGDGTGKLLSGACPCMARER
jgi:hypothetical protein